MRYLDRIKTNNPDEANNALVIGQALHTGIEKGIEASLHEYAFSYPIISDDHIHEMMKLEVMIPKAKAHLPPGGEFEVEISDEDFRGFIDYLVPVGSNEFDIYDFKYSNNVQNYRDSKQLHLYKYFFERDNPGKKIRNLYFLFVSKVQIRKTKDESLEEFRQRLEDRLEKAEVKIEQINFNIEAVIDFLFEIKKATETTDFCKTENHICRFCEYQEFCKEGWNYFMKLPENKRRSIDEVTKRVMWIYGAPFSGKTTFANNFPDPLMINTDGNIKYVDAPYIRIRDEIKVEGRITKRTFAWLIFKDVITELEKKDNSFKTIVVDLVEDLYEHCRRYKLDEMGLSHESDDTFRAWDKVRSEFLNTLKRLMNLDYENIILISHEDAGRDITKKGGDRITAIKPNIPDKVALKVAGMVDVVARIVADSDKHTFNFKSNEVIFGGGRLKVDAKDIPLDVNELFKVYDEANKAAKEMIKKTKRSGGRKKKEEPKEDFMNIDESAGDEIPFDASEDAENASNKPEESVEDAQTDDGASDEEKPVERKRRRRKE